MEAARVMGQKIAYRHRPRGPEAVVFIHGLGASMNSFYPAFEMEEFSEYTLAALDLPGCGSSGRPHDFSYTMKDQAELVLAWIKGLSLGAVTVVAHSMGGVIGLYVAESLSVEEVRAFINLEGNLGYDDCTFSGRIAAYTLEEFLGHGYEEFKRDLEERLERDAAYSLKNYYENILRVHPPALYLSSVSLVAESRRGDLMARFSALAQKSCYVFGENSLIPASKSFLEAAGIPYLVVPESGHFMMDDQPGLFYRMLLAELVKPGFGG